MTSLTAIEFPCIGKRRAVPNFPFHYFGVESAILQQLLAVPKFREQRARHRDTGEGSNGASMFNGEWRG